MPNRNDNNPTEVPRRPASVARLELTLNLATGELIITGHSPSPLLSLGMLEMAIEALKNDNLREQLGKKGLIEVVPSRPGLGRA